MASVKTKRGTSSGNRGKPISGLFAVAERKYPGIERKVGLSSAALRAGELVRGMRKAKGITQTELADLLGWDQVRISNIERGEGTLGPTFDILTKIADACGYDFQFTQRENPAVAHPKPLRDAIVSRVTGYAEAVGEAISRIGDVVAPKPKPQPEPTFVYACNAFVSGFGEDMPVHAEIVEGIVRPFSDTIKIAGFKSHKKVERAMGMPFIEVTGGGQRMVMVPYAVEPAPAVKSAATDIEIKIFANRLPGQS